MTKPPMEDEPCGCRGCNVCMMRLALSGVMPPDLPRMAPAHTPPLAMAAPKPKDVPRQKRPEPKKDVQKPLFE